MAQTSRPRCSSFLEYSVLAQIASRVGPFSWSFARWCDEASHWRSSSLYRWKKGTGLLWLGFDHWVALYQLARCTRSVFDEYKKWTLYLPPVLYSCTFTFDNITLNLHAIWFYDRLINVFIATYLWRNLSSLEYRCYSFCPYPVSDNGKSKFWFCRC